MTGVGRVFPGPPPVTALQDADLVIEPGAHLAITGPSGAGKSTLLNILGILDRPTSGSYELNGIDVSFLRESERSALRGWHIGFVFQNFHLLPYRSALENVELAQVYCHRSHSMRYAVAKEALDKVGLAHRLHALPRTLSGGERQRVAIARAVVNMPRLLLCDEPTGNLDSAATESVLELLDELNSRGLTIIVVTHDASVAARARRTISVLDGSLVHDEARGSRHQSLGAQAGLVP